MIVGRFFDGDEDIKLSWKQHEVYRQALSSIIETCNRLTHFAKTLLNDKMHEEWGSIESCDHRTLQGAHDLLAATWRFRNAQSQAELPLEIRPDLLVPHTPENLWLWWLHDELESWILQPELVQNVQLILTNQNLPVGYAAESRLCVALLGHFHDVPWTAGCRDAYEKDMASGFTKPANRV